MKKTLLAVLAGFAVSFVAGFVSAPPAEAQVTVKYCRTNADCSTYCAGEQGLCGSDGWSGRGTCFCP